MLSILCARLTIKVKVGIPELQSRMVPPPKKLALAWETLRQATRKVKALNSAWLGKGQYVTFGFGL